MSDASSGEGRNRKGKGGRGRGRRPEPKPTGFQKFIKAVTFGLIDPFEAQKRKRRAARKSAPGKERSAKKRGEGKGDRTRRAPEYVEPTNPRLYVGNLDYGVSGEDLRSLFSEAGTVVDASVVTRGDSGRSKGFGFVEMSSLEEAKKAATSLNDRDVSGRKMLVTGAKAPKPGDERESRSRSGGRRREDDSSDSRPPRERSEKGRREGRGGRRERAPRSEDFGDKGSRQVKPIEIEQVSGPRVLLANVNSDAGEVDLDDLLDGIGDVVSRVSRDQAEGSDTKDFEIEFSETAGAQKAVELLHGKSFMGRSLRVSGLGEGAPVPSPTEDVSTEDASTDGEAA